jgi:DNA-binding transcriptional MerR regulator
MPKSTGNEPKRLQVGEFAKSIGKTVRALHLYEELGLLHPVSRSKGGFRLYDEASVERARWIVKLQGIGFTLAQIQGFVADFEAAKTGRVAANQAKEIFSDKLADLRSQIAKLQGSERDLVEAVEYLNQCSGCADHYAPSSCVECDHNGHEPDEVPELFAGLSEAASPYHVDAESLSRAGANRSREDVPADASAKRGDG